MRFLGSLVRLSIPVIVVSIFGSQSYSQDLRQIKSNQQSCTSQTSNYVGKTITGRPAYYCVNSAGVIYRSIEGGVYAGEIGRIGVQIRDRGTGVCGGIAGIPASSCDNSSIKQYNIEGEKLMRFSCRGYQKCTGPVSSKEVAVRRR